MALWFALSLMTIGAVFAVLWPLARKPERVEAANDLAVYRDQLEEVRRDRAAQSIGEKEAAAAEVEISRRLIATADAMPSTTIAPSGAMTWRRRIVAAAALALLPIGAAGCVCRKPCPF
jgi:cytochrome c-type biogenesis protein CcmH